MELTAQKDSGKLMIYVLSAVTEIEGLEKQYRQLTGAKARIGQQMDSLDIMDKILREENIRIWRQGYTVCMMKLKAWRIV